MAKRKKPVSPVPPKVIRPGLPQRGGFLREFGCGEFILDYLVGQGQRHGADNIDPRVGAPQADIFAAYKQAQRTSTAESRATSEAQRQLRSGKVQLAPTEVGRCAQEDKLILELTDKYLAKIKLRSFGATSHSFVVYFSRLERLGWVEPTGQEEPSLVQNYYPAGPPRRYYRLSAAGRAASSVTFPDTGKNIWSNPQRVVREQSGVVLAPKKAKPAPAPLKEKPVAKPVVVAPTPKAKPMPAPPAPAPPKKKRVTKPAPAAPVIPEEVAAEKAEEIVEALEKKWRDAKARNSKLAEEDLDELEMRWGYDVKEAREKLQEYKDTARADFESAEEYSEARADAWQEFVDSISTISKEEEEEEPKAAPAPPKKKRVAKSKGG